MITTDDAKVLLGRKVEMLCFAQFCAYIHFDRNILLTIETEFVHVHGRTGGRHSSEFPVTESSLMRLLECLVVSASIIPQDELCLFFSNGDSLHVLKIPGYESYRLAVGTDEQFA